MKHPDTRRFLDWLSRDSATHHEDDGELFERLFSVLLVRHHALLAELRQQRERGPL